MHQCIRPAPLSWQVELRVVDLRSEKLAGAHCQLIAQKFSQSPEPEPEPTRSRSQTAAAAAVAVAAAVVEQQPCHWGPEPGVAAAAKGRH